MWVLFSATEIGFVSHHHELSELIVAILSRVTTSTIRIKTFTYLFPHTTDDIPVF